MFVLLSTAWKFFPEPYGTNFIISKIPSIANLLLHILFTIYLWLKSAFLKILFLFRILSFKCFSPKKMGVPDHLTCLLRNLYARQEATVRTGHGTTDWFQIRKGVCQRCILSPLCAEYIMQRRWWHPTPVVLPAKSHGQSSLVGCSPWGCKVRHNWATSLSLFTFMHWRRKWQPTPVFLPGESQGWGSLVGCHLWGHTESDTTEVT